MECYEFCDIDIAHTVAIGHAKYFFMLNMLGHAFQASACHGFFARVYKCHAPRFRLLLVHFHFVVRHVKSHIGHMQEIVGEIFLDDVAAVTAANDKVVHAVRGIHFHDVPQNGAPTNFNHWLWFEMGFL